MVPFLKELGDEVLRGNRHQQALRDEWDQSMVSGKSICLESSQVNDFCPLFSNTAALINKTSRRVHPHGKAPRLSGLALRKVRSCVAEIEPGTGGGALMSETQYSNLWKEN